MKFLKDEFDISDMTSEAQWPLLIHQWLNVGNPSTSFNGRPSLRFSDSYAFDILLEPYQRKLKHIRYTGTKWLKWIVNFLQLYQVNSIFTDFVSPFIDANTLINLKTYVHYIKYKLLYITHLTASNILKLEKLPRTS